MQLPADATGSVATVSTTEYKHDTIRPYLPKQDPTLIQRLVGYYEYSQCLNLLDALTQSATSAELDVIDEIVKSEAEFTVYVNLARRLDQGRSTIVEQPQRAGDDFSRRGIRWVTALARVELGAMVAGYTQHPAPFAVVAGPGYDAAEYRELIIDGAKTHAWSFENDPQVARVFGAFEPSSKTLAYIRRLNVANAFVYAAAGASGFPPNSPQAAELATYAQQLGRARAALETQINRYLASAQTVTKRGGTSNQTILLEMCRQGVCQKLSDAPAANPKP